MNVVNISHLESLPYYVLSPPMQVHDQFHLSIPDLHHQHPHLLHVPIPGPNLLPPCLLYVPNLTTLGHLPPYLLHVPNLHALTHLPPWLPHVHVLLHQPPHYSTLPISLTRITISLIKRERRQQCLMVHTHNTRKMFININGEREQANLSCCRAVVLSCCRVTRYSKGYK